MMAPTILGHNSLAFSNSAMASRRRLKAAKQVPRPKCARAEGIKLKEFA